jgi:protein-tyrosine-phosphatase
MPLNGTVPPNEVALQGRDNGLVLFVCPHGAGKSRMAAAFFNAIGVPGWSATSAGVTPQRTVSAHASRLLAGTPAAQTLDTELPRAIDEVASPSLTVAIDCTTLPTPEAVAWHLRHQEFDTPMREEIRDQVAQLAKRLSAPPGAARRDGSGRRGAGDQ